MSLIAANVSPTAKKHQREHENLDQYSKTKAINPNSSLSNTNKLIMTPINNFPLYISNYKNQARQVQNRRKCNVNATRKAEGRKISWKLPIVL